MFFSLLPTAYKCAAATASPTTEEHRELRRRQHHLPVLRRRPHESTALKTFRKQARPRTVPPDQLVQIASTTSEGEEVTRIRIGAQNLVHLRRKTGEPPGACRSPRRTATPASRPGPESSSQPMNHAGKVPRYRTNRSGSPDGHCKARPQCSFALRPVRVTLQCRRPHAISRFRNYGDWSSCFTDYQAGQAREGMRREAVGRCP